eukprot:11169210-Prorocentrum_lima.AAC.1
MEAHPHLRAKASFIFAGIVVCYGNPFKQLSGVFQALAEHFSLPTSWEHKPGSSLQLVSGGGG